MYKVRYYNEEKRQYGMLIVMSEASNAEVRKQVEKAINTKTRKVVSVNKIRSLDSYI